ncbi:MAG: hypothetical protein QHC79_04545 [Pseudosphingobacterium sp.]|nr:hypothetical protein [Pseudosphingobacterium sp.]
MNKRYNIAVLFFLLVFGACKDDFLDRKPMDSISDADVWKDPALVQSYVNELYVDVWDPFIDSWKVMHTAITDEGMYLRDKGTDVVLKGTFTPENMGTLTQSDDGNRTIRRSGIVTSFLKIWIMCRLPTKR